jgi:hypothetical protein
MRLVMDVVRNDVRHERSLVMDEGSARAATGRRNARRHATWFASVMLVAAIGCGDDAVPPPTPRDGGTRDAGFDGATIDDAGLDDAGLDDATIDPDAGRDAGMRDAGSFDGGSYTFGDDCLDEEGRFDLCRCGVPECDPEASPACVAGLRCVPDGCGRTTCQPGGHACVDASDCPVGSECFAARALDGSTAEVCLHPTGGCTDSRDCAVGFACESGACVDRRVSCADAGCPFSFFCQDADTWARPYCTRVSRRCSSFAGACPPFFSCVDVDGDGLSECRRNGEACDSNEDCRNSVCGYDPTAKALACQAQGPCDGPSDCGGGFTCADLWGDGVRECVPAGGTCATSASCEVGAVCAPPASGGAPTCVAAEAS